MEPYQFEDATRTSANYPPWTAWRTIQLIFLVITFPIWIIPYLIVRWFRRKRELSAKQEEKRDERDIDRSIRAKGLGYAGAHRGLRGLFG